MDILTQKRITNNGDGLGYFWYCVQYVYLEKPEPGEELIQRVGYGVCDSNPKMTYKQMFDVKEYFGKTGDNPVMHFVVAFDKKTVYDADTACDYTKKIALLFAFNYQVITAVHLEDQGGSLYHAHFIVNTVSFLDGKLYHSGPKELMEIVMFINYLTGNYVSSEIKYVGSNKEKKEKKSGKKN